MEKKLADRKNEGKLPYDCIPPIALEGLAIILQHGAEKYSKHNWLKGMPHAVSYASFMRHLQKWWAGQDIDEESGYPHTYHIIWNAMVILTMEHLINTGDARVDPEIIDDRPFKYKPKNARGRQPSNDNPYPGPYQYPI